MNPISFFVATLFALVFFTSAFADPEPIFDGGVVTVPLSLAAIGGTGGLALLGAGKLLLAKKLLLSQRRRGRRSADPAPILDGGAITIPLSLAAIGGTGGLALLGGAKLLLAKKLLLSQSRRGKRSAEPEPIFDGGVITIPASTLLAAKVIGLKALALKGIASSLRGKRSAEPEPIFDGGVVTVPLSLAAIGGTGGLALLGGAKLLLAKKLLLSQSRRGKRSAEPIFDGGVVTVPLSLAAIGGTGGLALLGGAKLLLAKKLLLSQSRRGKRSAEPEPIFDGGAITIPLSLAAIGGTGGLAVLGGAKLLLAKKLLLNRRGKRSAEPFFDGGVITIPVGTLALAKIIGLKALAFKGIAASSRGRRSVIDDAEFEAELFAASVADSDDCAKKTVCLVNAKPVDSLNEEESFVQSLFGSTESIDYTKRTVEFDLAALMGRNAGAEQCEAVYSRCPHSLEKLFEIAASV